MARSRNGDLVDLRLEPKKKDVIRKSIRDRQD